MADVTDIRRIVREKGGDGDILNTLDSLELIELISEIETQTGVQVPNEQLGQFRTFTDLIEYFEARC